MVVCNRREGNTQRSFMKFVSGIFKLRQNWVRKFLCCKSHDLTFLMNIQTKLWRKLSRNPKTNIILNFPVVASSIHSYQNWAPIPSGKCSAWVISELIKAHFTEFKQTNQKLTHWLSSLMRSDKFQFQLSFPLPLFENCSSTNSSNFTGTFRHQFTMFLFILSQDLIQSQISPGALNFNSLRFRSALFNFQII